MSHVSGFTSTEWAGLVASVRPSFMKGVTDTILRDRILLAHLRRKGRIKTNVGGESCSWVLNTKLPQPQTHGDGQRLTFARNNPNEHATVGFREYVSTGALTWRNQMQNKGKDVIVSLLGQTLKNIKQGMEDWFNGQLYVDGEANPMHIHGLDSFTGVGTTVAADKIAKPSDTYATVSTAVNSVGAVTWSTEMVTPPNASIGTDWPWNSGANGALDTQYDFWSPLLWNWSSTSWDSGGTTWVENCLDVLKTLSLIQARRTGKSGTPDLFICDAQMCIDMKTVLETRIRTLAQHKSSNDLGFVDVPVYNGIGMTTDYNCPANSGYGINLSAMQLLSQTPELFYMPDPLFDQVEDANLFLIRFLGNMTYDTPRNFCKVKNYA